MADDATRALIAALVRPEHHRRYVTSASFKHAVDTLAVLLPAWVDGIAVMSDEEDARMDAAIEAMKWDTVTPRSWTLGPDGPEASQ